MHGTSERTAVAPRSTTGTVLLVEDDEAMAEVIELGLTAAGLHVDAVRVGLAAIEHSSRRPPSVIVLDLGLPDMDGLEVCRRVRARTSTPILVVTARSSSRDVVAGLEAGADDYVTKPFVVPELLARVRAALRRTTQHGDELHQVGDLSIDTGAHLVTRGGEAIHLSSTEYRLLVELARRRGRVCTREALLRSVWGYEYLGDSRLIDMAVKRLRDRVERDPSAPELVVTVRGVGYRLDG